MQTEWDVKTVYQSLMKQDLRYGTVFSVCECKNSQYFRIFRNVGIILKFFIDFINDNMR